MSTLSLEKNGRTSSSKRTKHIKAKYFFIQHYHQTNEITIRYCPTDSMWADVLTKPLQGSKFYHMHAILMNCPVDYHEEPPLISPTPMPVPSLSTVPINSRLLKTKTLLRECVEISSPTILKSGGKEKKVTWKGSCTSTTPRILPYTRSHLRGDFYRKSATAE